MRLPAIALAAMLCTQTGPAAAADLDWQVVTGHSASYIERQVQRWASTGYRVQAVVADAPEATIVLAGEARLFRKMPAVAEYRVLDPGDAARVQALGAEGFVLRAIGRGRTGPALAVFERSVTARNAARDYRSVQVAPAADVQAPLEAAAADGYRVVGALGDTGSEWLILERESASNPKESASKNAAARESRVIAAPDVEKLEGDINRLASEGFECDAVWNRPPKGLALFKGGTLTAALSRRRGVASPAAHVTIDRGRQPSQSGRLIALVPYRNSFVFVIRRASQSDYSIKEVLFPDRDAKSSWLDEGLLEKLRGQWWSPIDLAWAITSSGKVTSWVGLERRETINRYGSSTALTRRDAETIPVPAGARALPNGGGEPGDAYRAFLAAIARGDLPGTKALWTGPQRASWEKRVKDFKAPLGMGFSEKDLFKSMREGMATDPAILGGWVDTDRAQIRLEATTDGTRAVADIDLVREAGIWKISQQHSWKPLAAGGAR
jgi:hypothetical protein